MIRTLLFDMDGTLVDTEPLAAKSVEICFRKWGIPVSSDDAHYVTGRTWAKAFEYFDRKYVFPMGIASAMDEVLAHYRSSLAQGAPIVPGSVEAVRALCGSFPLALVSGSHRQEIEAILRGLGIWDCFRVVLGAEDYPQSKPAPDGYLKAMQMLGARSQETLCFEDSEAGIASARAAGVHVVAITGTNHTGAKLEVADQCLPDFLGVDEAWVRAFKSSRNSG